MALLPFDRSCHRLSYRVIVNDEDFNNSILCLSYIND